MKLAPEELILIIDPQKDFTSAEGAYAQKHSEMSQIIEVKARINKLLKRLDKDKVVIVFSNYQKDQFEIGLSMCIPNTIGHEMDIDLNKSFRLISKTEHSCFTSDELRSLLANGNFSTLLLCGFLAEYCVKQTAIDLLLNGYKVSLLKEYIGTADDVQYRKHEMLIELESLGAEIINGTFD